MSGACGAGPTAHCRCSHQASQGYRTTPSKPCLPSHCIATMGGSEPIGGYSWAVASSEDGQMPHKYRRTELAPCMSPPVGTVAGNIKARRNHAIQRLKSICQDLPAPESLNYPCCGGTACKPWLPRKGPSHHLASEGLASARIRRAPFCPDRHHRRPKTGSKPFISHHAGPSV